MMEKHRYDSFIQRKKTSVFPEFKPKDSEEKWTSECVLSEDGAPSGGTVLLLLHPLLITLMTPLKEQK